VKNKKERKKEQVFQFFIFNFQFSIFNFQYPFLDA